MVRRRALCSALLCLIALTIASACWADCLSAEEDLDTQALIPIQMQRVPVNMRLTALTEPGQRHCLSSCDNTFPLHFHNGSPERSGMPLKGLRLFVHHLGHPLHAPPVPFLAFSKK